MEERPRNLKAMLSEAKDTSELMVDLGYASLFFGDTGTNLGNGGTGFALVLDAFEAAAVNAACGASLSGCITMAAETTIWNANDGPDSFFLFRSNGVTSCTPGVDCDLPEPITLSLFGAGLAGAVAVRRRRRKQSA